MTEKSLERRWAFPITVAGLIVALISAVAAVLSIPRRDPPAAPEAEPVEIAPGPVQAPWPGGLDRTPADPSWRDDIGSMTAEAAMDDDAAATAADPEM